MPAPDVAAAVAAAVATDAANDARLDGLRLRQRILARLAHGDGAPTYAPRGARTPAVSRDARRPRVPRIGALARAQPRRGLELAQACLPARSRS